MSPLRVFIGFDPRQPLAFTVAAHSVMVSASVPVSVTPLILRQLPIKRRGLTEFTFSRYLPPYLCGYKGRALFIDADMMVRGDIAELPWDSPHDVCIVQHDSALVGGQRVSTRFERPSVMLFNCELCRVLTPEFIDDEQNSPQDFSWASSIGNLPPEWNHLVGYSAPNPNAKLVHFTQGIPCFPETANDEYGQEWRQVLDGAISTVTWQEIMGPSVHRRFKAGPPGVSQLLAMQGVSR